MSAARQQQWRCDFPAITRIHLPVALASMVLVVMLFAAGLRRGRLDDLTLLAGTVSPGLLGNPFVCGVISRPHDRYGARIRSLAPFLLLIAAARYFDGTHEPDEPRSSAL